MCDTQDELIIPEDLLTLAQICSETRNYGLISVCALASRYDSLVAPTHLENVLIGKLFGVPLIDTRSELSLYWPKGYSPAKL